MLLNSSKEVDVVVGFQFSHLSETSGLRDIEFYVYVNNFHFYHYDDIEDYYEVLVNYKEQGRLFNAIQANMKYVNILKNRKYYVITRKTLILYNFNLI